MLEEKGNNEKQLVVPRVEKVDRNEDYSYWMRYKKNEQVKGRGIKEREEYFRGSCLVMNTAENKGRE